MFEKISRLFGGKSLDRKLEPMSEGTSFRRALFTGVGLESYAPCSFNVCNQGRRYEVEIDEDMNAEVRAY